MADEADNAGQINDDFMTRALADHANRRTPAVAAVGHCLNPACGDTFPAGDPRKYCNGECADEAARHDR